MGDAPESKKKDVRTLFQMRMEREGRSKEWYANLKRCKKETGKPHGPCVWQVMKEMGYEGPEKERALYQDYLDNLHKTAQQREREKKRAERSELKNIKDWEEAVAALPDKVSVSKELDWIRAHPAMARKSRQKDKITDIEISVDDIIDPPQGPAPSKAAVFSLQHWANNPNEFFKQILNEHRKQTEDGGEATAGGEVEDDLSEVERMLRQVSSRAMDDQEPADGDNA